MLVEKMEVIVLHKHLQMITSPHHQGTSHLQAKEVTKNTSNYQGGNTNKKSQHHQGKKIYCQDWRLVWSQPAKRYTFRVIVNSWICRDWMENRKRKCKNIFSRNATYIHLHKKYESLFFLLKNKRISQFTSQISLIIIFTIFPSCSSLKNQKSIHFSWIKHVKHSNTYGGYQGGY